MDLIFYFNYKLLLRQCIQNLISAESLYHISFVFYPPQQCIKMHSFSKKSTELPLKRITATHSSHKGNFCCFLFCLTVQSSQLKEIHMWIQFQLVHPLSCLLCSRQLQLRKPSDGIRGHRCKQGTNLACKTCIIGDNR